MDGMHNSNSIWDRDIRNEDTKGAPGLQPQEMPDRSAGTAVLEREETDEKNRRGDDGDNDRYAPKYGYLNVIRSSTLSALNAKKSTARCAAQEVQGFRVSCPCFRASIAAGGLPG